jgi:uncharacterized membrane protein
MVAVAAEPRSRSIAKAVSWRIAGTVDTLVLSLIFTGSFRLAGSIAGTEMITKMLLYYLHERVWSRIGRRTARLGGH